MNRNRTLRQALGEYIPDKAIEPVVEWFDKHFVVLRITRSRRSKLGDFKSAPTGKPCHISINHDLNPFNFLITLLHEMAHAEVHFNYTRRMQPHGRAWKLAYRKIAQPYIDACIFPDDLNKVFANYLNNPQASSTACLALAQALKIYDPFKEEITVSMLTPETIFSLPDGRKFKVIEKLRKRYRCYCLDNKKTYLFNPMAVIHPQKGE